MRFLRFSKSKKHDFWKFHAKNVKMLYQYKIFYKYIKIVHCWSEYGLGIW